MKCFGDEVSSADVGSASNMLRICKFMVSFENVCCQMFHIVASFFDASLRPEESTSPFAVCTRTEHENQASFLLLVHTRCLF